MLLGLEGLLPEKWQLALGLPWLQTALAFVTALIITLMTGAAWIRWLKRFKLGQVVRDDGPQSHLTKSGTPTMGGIIMLVAIYLSMTLWSTWSPISWYLALVTLAFALIGLWDDLQKLAFKSARGLPARWKYCLQSIAAISALIWASHFLALHDLRVLFIPYWHLVLPLGGWLMVLGYFVIVGSSNAVNLTDGLDGLAIGPIVLVALAMGIFALLCNSHSIAKSFHLPWLSGASQVAVFGAAIAGAGVGFLKFNLKPAKVFMGDVGSLSLGAALGAMAVILRQELMLFVIGFVFVIEAVSVILQVGSYKLRKKRIFKMAPLHHHFELKGWSEGKVVAYAWLASLLLLVLGLVTLLF